jgi:hypothetical protein
MENIYEKVVKLTAEILKSWKANPGVVSPFSSSSSQHQEVSDNHLEHYVPKPSTETTSDVSSIFNSDLFTNGGEKMTEKTLDVNASETTNTSYTNPGSATTEPDPQSAIAITKSDVPHGSSDVDGVNTYSTTANSTEEAPASGDTTEPMAKAEDCPNCNKPMNMCMCDGMNKAADMCPGCNKPMAECSCVTKSAHSCPTCGGDSCKDCGKSLHLCNCAGMSKVTGDRSEDAKDIVKDADGDSDKDSSADTDDDSDLEKKEFSTTRRKQLAREGKAMGDGSYPIESEQDLKNAIRSWGRGGADPKVKQHIIRRAKAMGKQSVLPEGWMKDMQKSEWAGFFLPVD